MNRRDFMNNFNKTELQKKAIQVFSVCHALPFSSIDESEKESLGYFYPPFYGFIPSELRSVEMFEVPWLYTFWHELRHIEDVSLSNLGIYTSALDSLAEELVIYGVYLIVEGDSSRGEACLKKAREVIIKENILHQTSMVAKELTPTCLQLMSKSQDDVSREISDNLSKRFFPKIKISKSMVKGFVERAGTTVSEAIIQNKSEQFNIRPEHQEAFIVGKNIYELFGDFAHIPMSGLLSMDIDLTDIDLVGIDPGALKHKIYENPELYVPDRRLNALLKRGEGFLEKMKKTTESTAPEILNEYARIFDHPSLPSEMREKYTTVIDERAEVSRQKVEAIGNLEEVLKSQTVYSSSAERGDIFFLMPIFVEKDMFDEFTQTTLSKSYAYELIIRSLFGMSKYPDKFLSTMRSSLDEFDFDGKSNYHLFAEKILKKHSVK